MVSLYLSNFIFSAFFASLVFLKKKKETKDIVLMLFILLFGFESFMIFATYKGWNVKLPEILYFDFAFWTLLGPLLLFYIEFTTRKEFKLKPIQLFHLLPMAIVITSNWDYVYYLSKGINDRAYLIEKNSYYTYLGVFIFEFVALFYNIWAIIKLQKHRKKIPNYFSNTKYISLTWLYYFTYGFAFYLSLAAINLLINQLFEYRITESLYHYIGIVSFFYILGIGYFGYKQKGIFLDYEYDYNPNHSFNDNCSTNSSSISVEQKQIVDIEKGRYIKSGLKTDESKNLIEQLSIFMSTKKPYLDNEFNLKTLAEQLGTSQHKLSQLLNEYLHTNFFDFVNNYRIEEVIKLLSQPNMSNQKLISIAFDAGFNSKSTFYSAFKKHTSQTPTEYRKNLKSGSEL